MWREWGYFPKSRPRAAKGGIKAQTKRGQFGASWWAKRWIAVLESFDRDPFLLFRLRGLGREELFARLNEASPTVASAAAAEEAPRPAAEPLPADPKAFWGGGSLPEDLFSDVQPPPVSAAWPRRLGN